MLSGFKATKCKTSCSMALSRIKLLRQKHEIQLKNLRRETAELLGKNQLDLARVRVEAVTREVKMLQAYGIVELYLELLKVRVLQLEKVKEMPGDMQEACSSLIYASARMMDITELVTIRKQLQSKFGKDYANEAASDENCGRHNVNVNLQRCLYVDPPSTMSKFEVMSEIAQEHSVEWDAQRAYEEMGLAQGTTVVDDRVVAPQPHTPAPVSMPLAVPHPVAASEYSEPLSDNYSHIQSFQSVPEAPPSVPNPVSYPPQVPQFPSTQNDPSQFHSTYKPTDQLPSVPNSATASQQYPPPGYAGVPGHPGAPGYAAAPRIPEYPQEIENRPVDSDKLQDEPPAHVDPKLAAAQAAYDAAPGPPVKPYLGAPAPPTAPPAMPTAPPSAPPPASEAPTGGSGGEVDELERRLQELMKKK